ncbi:MAG: hypothetical protein FWD23_14700, partial [Oscillospiraceae bacterium]|nr:hypothetical protein [Oscillospiraceae bacterium]
GGIINISGGNIKAYAGGSGNTTGVSAAGIGGGGNGVLSVTTVGSGNITISGGYIDATGHNKGAGIGSGPGANSGTITITGGMIVARSEDTYTSGVGGGAASKIDVKITGGSVYSVNSTGNIRVNYNPHNGTAPVYLIGIKMIDENEIILPHLDISVNVTGAANYNYSAATNAQGITYMWLPEGSHDFLVYNPDTGTYLDYTMTVVKPQNTDEYDPATNTATIQILSTNPQWSFSDDSNGAQVYGSTVLNLSINHNNAITNPIDKREIVGVKWYRESAVHSEYAVNLQEAFNTGYANASSSNKGIGGIGEDLELVNAIDAHNHQYSMTIDKNGRYWVQIHYKGANTGKNVYHSGYIDVINIYTPVEVYVREADIKDNTEIMPYTKLDGTHGVACDLDGTPMANPSHGFDTAVYTRNPNLPAKYWDMIVPGSPFAQTAADADQSVLTLDHKMDNSVDTAANNDATHKYYTVTYGRNATVSETTLTIYKLVEGSFGNTEKAFSFKVSFYEEINSEEVPLAGAQFIYTGGVCPGSDAEAPAGGTLMLDGAGSAEFKLKHGQSITIEAVSVDCLIQIEEEAPSYTAFFKDSEQGEELREGSNTGILNMTESPRFIGFTNIRHSVPPTGITAGDANIPLFLLAILAGSGFAYFAANIVYRRFRNQKNPS